MATLEALLPELLGRSRNPGDSFVELCCAVLAELGFTAIHKRRGSEQGRDIDAVYGDLRWFFECKLAREKVATESAAYKLAQVDMLASAQQPDVFVYLSNAAAPSILRDIVTSRQTLGRYDVELWCNEPHDRTFDALMLSAAGAVVTGLEALALDRGQEWPAVVKDFHQRAAAPAPASRLAEVLRRPRRAGASPGAVVDARRALRLLQQAWKECGPHGLGLDPTGEGPVRPTPGLLLFAAPLALGTEFDFSTLLARRAFAGRLSGWEMHHSHSDTHRMLFREPLSADRTLTMFTTQGGIVTYSYLASTWACLEPEEWLAPLREDSMRMRNYAQAGLLTAPFVLQMQLHLPDNVTWIGGLERLLHDESWSLPLQPHDRPLGELPLVSDAIAFGSAPQHSQDVAAAILPSFWRRAGFPRPPLTHLERLFEHGMHTPETTASTVARLLYRVAWVLPWAVDTRPFEEFVPD